VVTREIVVYTLTADQQNTLLQIISLVDAFEPESDI